MTIYSRKSHAQGIPIVPMLDILTILLIFFIVHTEIKHQVNVLPLNLPQTHHLAGSIGSADDILLEVADDGSLAFNGRVIPAGELESAVKELVQRNPDAKVQVSAATGASMGRFIEVMDRLSAAGLTVEEVPVRIDVRTEE
ncbi:MAG: biopolymer transporter ExbD [Akkermansia sp.]|nr:biopolymer transporter ExbD [Akkermansia sp.]